VGLTPPSSLDDEQVVYWKELVNRVHAAVSATETPDDAPTMEQVEAVAQNIPGADDPHVGFDSLPDGWDRSTVLEVWTKVGGSFTSCKAKFMGEEGWSDRKSDRFCAALKDEVRQSEEWREGGGQANLGPLSMVPGVPNRPKRITRDMLEDMVRWKMNQLREQAAAAARLPPLAASLSDTVEVAADWNPALHPRGPDGKFVKRPWSGDLLPDNLGDASSVDMVHFLAETEGEPDMNAVLSDDTIRIDGVPNDVNRVEDLPTETSEPDVPIGASVEDIPDGQVGPKLTDNGVSQLSEGDVVAVDDTVARVEETNAHFMRVDRGDGVEELPTIDHTVRAIDTDVTGDNGGVPPEVDLSRSVDSEVSDYSDHITIHELEGGGTAFEKDMVRVEDFPYTNPDEHEAEGNRSVAAAEVLEQAGVPVPTHHYDAENERLVVEGVDGPELASVDGPVDPEMVDTESFVEVMAGSVLVGNRDIHGGNFIVDDGGVPQPVDNGLAATESDDKKLVGMSEGATGLAKQVGLDVSADDIQERMAELSRELDMDVVEDGWNERGVPDHWKENLRSNIEKVRRGGYLDGVGSEADTEKELTVDLPDDAPDPALPDEDLPLEQGGPRPVPEDATAEEIAQSFPTINERFSEEIELPSEGGVPDNNLDPEMFDKAARIMGEDLTRFKDDRVKSIVAGRISHIDGPGKKGVSSDAMDVSFSYLDVPEEQTAAMSAINHADNAADTTATHELQHATDTAMGYTWGGEQSGSNGGIHEYATEDPTAETTEHGHPITSAMLRAEGADEPIGLSDFYTDARSEVEFNEAGGPKELEPDTIEERLTEDLPGDPADAYRRYVREVNRAFFKAQEYHNRADKNAVRDVIKMDYQMTNAGEFSAEFAETMNNERPSTFAIRKYVNHHPGLVAAWLNMRDVPEKVREEIERYARIRGVEL